VSTSDRAYLSIGEVLALLQDEFPDITISKIRFLESQGLIDPERTPSGYRKFYANDVERLRFILREQKERFLPLKVIKDRLASTSPETGTLVATPPEADREPIWMAAARERGVDSTTNGTAAAGADAGESVDRLTADQLCGATGLSRRELDEVERYGLVTGRTIAGVTYYDHDASSAAHVAAFFLGHGVEPRHLRMYRNSVDREAALFEQIVMPLVRQRNPQARSQALATLLELTRRGSELREVLLVQALRPYLEAT
jgi:DNA-binding transcriptional MerR regulator